MRWSNNRDRSSDAGNRGIEDEGNAHLDANNDEELLAVGRHEGKRRFLLFRRRRSDLDMETGENERAELLSSESDQDSTYANTTVAAVATGLSRQKEGTSLLDCSNGEISNGVDEGSIDDDQSTDTKETGSLATFNWFGLFKNNGTSSCEEERRNFEYTSIDNLTSMVVDDDDESINGVDNDTTADSAKPRFNWFGLLQPSNTSSCVENVACEVHSAVIKQDEAEEEEKDDYDDNNGVCSDEGCSQYSSAEVSGKKPSDDSMDTNDIVLDISDDERLQALFDKCSAQRSDQQDEQQHSYCEDDEQCDAISHDVNKDNTESEFFVNKETPLSDEILALWKRRQRLKRKLQIDGPIVNRETAPMSMKMLGTSQMEAGGGRNEENLRSIELESHLIDKNSNYVDRKMAKMEIMTAGEKEREDLLYDLWLHDVCEMAGEEPEYGYDNLGWYSTLTTREDGEADLHYMNSFAMNVATEDDSSVNTSNPWLEGIGNAALFIFAPDLYFIQQMNESSQPQYHATSNKEDGEQDTGQKQGWFKKLFTNEGRRRDQ